MRRLEKGGLLSDHEIKNRRRDMKVERLFGFVLAGGLLLAGATGAMAEAGAEVKDLALKKIMKDLGAGMQTVTDAIAREDWQLVEKAAPQIADHPQPPLGEKMRIIAFMGTDMGKFKGYDGEVHKSAETLGQAAKSKDGVAVIAAFQSIQTACYGCHRDFREGFIKHFYGTR